MNPGTELAVRLAELAVLPEQKIDMATTEKKMAFDGSALPLVPQNAPFLHCFRRPLMT